MEDKIVAHILGTKDYDKFKFLRGNRAVNPNHVKAIMDSMTEEQLMDPITVNEKFEIIDGQHRFVAIKTLGLDVWYVIAPGYSSEQMIRFNISSRNWGLMEFFHHFLDLKSPQYVLIDNLAAEFEVEVSRVLDLHGQLHMRDGIRTNQAIKEGSFEVIDLPGLRIKLAQYVQIKDLWDFANSRGFCRAYRTISKHPNFEFERFFEQAKKYGYTLEKHYSAVDYCTSFQDLYNFRRRERVRIYNDL